MTNNMKITILGSGAWEGIPVPFCSCVVCRTALLNPLSKDNRTRPELLVENNKGGFLVEASPDIRLQSTRFNIPHITDFIISHWHFDHMYGLHDLLSWMKRSPQKPTVHCSSKTAKVLEKEFSYLPLSVNILKPFTPITLFDITVTPLPVYHMFGQDESVPEESLENTFAYVFESNGLRIAYLADYYRIPESTIQKIVGVDAVIADGTYLLTDQYQKVKKNHMHGEEILRFTKNLGAKNVYYHSISHLTKKKHEELQELLPPAHHIAFDGMQLS